MGLSFESCRTLELSKDWAQIPVDQKPLESISSTQINFCDARVTSQRDHETLIERFPLREKMGGFACFLVLPVEPTGVNTMENSYTKRFFREALAVHVLSA